MAVSQPTAPPRSTVRSDLSALRDVLRNPSGFLLTLSQAAGDIAQFSAGPVRIVSINRADLAQRVLVEQADAFRKMPAVRVIGALTGIVLGDNMRRRRERSAELVERAERAERERHLVAHQHVQEERTRIARELHDVVAHSVSLMVIQTAAARRQLLADPQGVDASLAAIEETGRTAMQEMRRILGVLRDVSGDAPLSPQPGLSAIEGLTASASDLPVSVHAEGDLDHLPVGVELSAFRIVQEALTNVRRHAGPVQHVDVSMVRLENSLTVEVTDDGRGAAASDNGEPGFGLMGMRERVAAYEGQLYAGPRPGGGWRVRAIFPVGVA